MPRKNETSKATPRIPAVVKFVRATLAVKKVLLAWAHCSSPKVHKIGDIATAGLITAAKVTQTTMLK